MTATEARVIVCDVLNRMTAITRVELCLVTGLTAGLIENTLQLMAQRGEVVYVKDRALSKQGKSQQDVYRIWLTDHCPHPRVRIKTRRKAYRQPPERAEALLGQWTAPVPTETEENALVAAMRAPVEGEKEAAMKRASRKLRRLLQEAA